MASLPRETYWALRSVIAAQRVAARKLELRRRAQAIISASSEAETCSAERAFEGLLREYSGPGEYGYGHRPNWLRGVQRAQQLVEACTSLQPGARTLEVACGDGMTSLALASFGAEVMLTDLQDWRDPRAQPLSFEARDLASEAALPGADFALVFSYNAFEHFPDPRTALARMVACLAPGGHLFVEFGPLYCGPWGLHAYRMLPMPFPQFLFREDFWREKLRSVGVRDLGQELEDIQPLNQWKVAEFETLFKGAGLEVVQLERIAAHDHLELVTRFPGSFQGRGLSLEDLTVHGLRVHLRKPA